MPPSLQAELKQRSKRRMGAGLALVAVIAVVGGIISQTGSSPSKRNTGGKGGAFNATTVTRRDLVQTDTESGTLSYASPQTVYNRLTGTVTWLPTIGQVIKPGAALFKVDGNPVTLMNGATPAYRDLTGSDTAGQDILELNRNLVALGFNPDGIIVDDQWQAATTAGVEAFQASLGETQTGSLPLGRVVFLPGDQLVSTVDATLGSTGGNSGQGNPSSSNNASDPSLGARPKFVSVQKPAAPKRVPPRGGGKGADGSGQRPGAKPGGHKPGGHKPAGQKRVGQRRVKTLEALIALLQAEIAELKAAQGPPRGSPSHGGRPQAANSGSPPSSSRTPPSNGASPPSNNANASGDGGGSASPILGTTSTRQIVTVNLDPSKQSEAKVGARVTVEMPAGNTVDGRISAVSSVAQTSSNSGNGNGNGNGPGGSNANSNGNSSNSGSTIPVTIGLSRRRPSGRLDQATVSVNFAQARANHVLSVSVTALLATAGGGYAVQSAAAPHQLTAVNTGLFAAGYVQISGKGIYSGLQVTDSQG